MSDIHVGLSAPRLADSISPAETRLGQSGDMLLASKGDHTHPRLTATATRTLDSNGEATIVFTRSFATQPAVSIPLVEASDNQPVVCKVKS